MTKKCGCGTCCTEEEYAEKEQEDSDDLKEEVRAWLDDEMLIDVTLNCGKTVRLSFPELEVAESLAKIMFLDCSVWALCKMICKRVWVKLSGRGKENL